MTDMQEESFAKQPYGRLALQKFGKVHENFRIFRAGWLGNRPEDFQIMEVDGAEFRVAKSGPDEGKLSIKVKGTERSVRLTKEEIKEFTEAEQSQKAS